MSSLMPATAAKNKTQGNMIDYYCVNLETSGRVISKINLQFCVKLGCNSLAKCYFHCNSLKFNQLS